MLSARGIRNACPRCQFTLGLLSKQTSRPQARLSQHSSTGAAPTRLVASHRSLYSSNTRAFSTSRSWRAAEEPSTENVDGASESIEKVVRDAKQRFRDTLPQGYLNEEEYALYVRLYGPPLRETEPEDVGIHTHADMGPNGVKTAKEGTLIRELESGEFEEITYRLPPQQAVEQDFIEEEEIREGEVVEEEAVELEEGMEEELDVQEIMVQDLDNTPAGTPDYVEAVARNQREHDALRKLQNDFKLAEEKRLAEEEAAEDDKAAAEMEEEAETHWPPEHGIESFDREPYDEDYTSGESRRFHKHTLAGRFHGSPVEISLPRDELIGPVREMLERTHIKHVRTAAEESFGGRGLPLSPVTPEGLRNGKMEGVGLPPGQRHMTHIEADAFLAGYLPPVYGSSMAVLREVRKRQGGEWLQDLLKRGDGTGPSILDAGAGGGALIAWDQIVQAEWEVLKEKGEVSGDAPPGKKTVLAASDRLRERLKNVLHNTTFLPRLPDYQHSGQMQGEKLDGGNQQQQRKTFDVIIASHLLLAEKQDHYRQAILNNLWSMVNPNGGVVIFVEKANPRGFEAVAHVRDTLLKRYLLPRAGQATEDQEDFNPAFHRVLEPGHIIAPCTTHSTCPMYKFPGKSTGRRDFCHFSQRFVAPTFYSKMSSGGTQGEVEFSYVAFQRGVSKDTEMTPHQATEKAFEGFEKTDEEPNMQLLPRLILPPLKRKGHVTLDVCTPEGKTERWTIPKSFSKLAYHDARKSRWGDLWAMGAKTRVHRNVRIGRGQDDGGKRAEREGKKGARKVIVTMDGGKMVGAQEKNAERGRRKSRKADKQGLRAELEKEMREDEERDDDEDDGIFDEEMEKVWAEEEAKVKGMGRRKVKE